MDRETIEKALEAKTRHCAQLERVASELAGLLSTERQQSELKQSDLKAKFQRLSLLQAQRITQLKENQKTASEQRQAFESKHRSALAVLQQHAKERASHRLAITARDQKLKKLLATVKQAQEALKCALTTELSLRRDLLDVQAAKDTLTNQLDEFRSAVETLNNESKIRQATLAETENEAKNLRTTLAELAKAHDAQKLVLAKSVDAEKRVQASAKHDQEKLKQHVVQLHELKNERVQLRGEINTLRETLADITHQLETKRVQLENEVQQLEATAETLKAERDCARKAIATETARAQLADTLEAERADLDRTCSQLNASLSSAEKTLTRNREELERLTQDRQRTESELKKVQTDLCDIRSDHERLSHSLSEAQATISQQAGELESRDALAVNLQRVAEECEYVNDQRDQLESQLSELEQSLDQANRDLTAERSAHAARVAEDAARLTALEDENDALVDSAAAAQRESEEISNELRTSAARVEVLKSRLNSMGEALARAASAADHRDALQRELHTLQTELADIDADKSRRLLNWENQQLKQSLADAKQPVRGGTQIERRRYATRQDPEREAARKALEQLEAQNQVGKNKRSLPSPAILMRVKSKLDA
ncbi:MAG: hypothetical protein AAGA11_16250 [Pseudomonadota bacterium]